MAEYIEREEAISTIRGIYCNGCDNHHGVMCRACSFDDAIEVLSDVPKADVEPAKYGGWVWDTGDVYMCSQCGEKSHVKEVMEKPVWEWCPCCGARMNGA